MSDKVKLPITMTPLTMTGSLKKGDVFLWVSRETGRFEIHTFHSDAGYGAKTFTDYNEDDRSSIIVNYSGICGILKGDDE